MAHIRVLLVRECIVKPCLDPPARAGTYHKILYFLISLALARRSFKLLTIARKQDEV